MSDFSNLPLYELQGLRNRVKNALITNLSGNLFLSNTIADAVSIANAAVNTAVNYTGFVGSTYTVTASTANINLTCEGIMTIEVNVAYAPQAFSISITTIDLISPQQEAIGYAGNDVE